MAKHSSGGTKTWTVNNSILCNISAKSIIYTNCIYIGEDATFFSQQTSSENIILPDCSSIFKTFNGTYTEEENFELTDEAKLNFLGTDGTQVGIYGGEFTYTPEVSYPHVIKKDIAVQTENGKLKVNITVGIGDKKQNEEQP